MSEEERRGAEETMQQALWKCSEASIVRDRRTGGIIIEAAQIPNEVDAHFDPANEEALHALGYVAGFGISPEDRSEPTASVEVDEQLAA